MAHVEKDGVVVGQLIQLGIGVPDPVVQKKTIGIQGMGDGVFRTLDGIPVGDHGGDDPDDIEGQNQDQQYNSCFGHQRLFFSFHMLPLPLQMNDDPHHSQCIMYDCISKVYFSKAGSLES